jgi:hypothetical protein
VASAAMNLPRVLNRKGQPFEGLALQ